MGLKVGSHCECCAQRERSELLKHGGDKSEWSKVGIVLKWTLALTLSFSLGHYGCDGLEECVPRSCRYRRCW